MLPKKFSLIRFIGYFDALLLSLLVMMRAQTSHQLQSQQTSERCYILKPRFNQAISRARLFQVTVEITKQVACSVFF